MRNKVIAAGVAALILLIGFGAWALGTQKATAPESDDTVNTQSSGTSEMTQTDQPVTEGEELGVVTITYNDGGFDKDSYTVKSGETVTLVNKSSRTLEFASDEHPTHRANPELNLSPLSAGQTTNFTPSKTGTWHIHDHLDEGMTTTLIVQ